MHRQVLVGLIVVSLGLGAFAFTAEPAHAQKAGKGEKVCKIKMKPSGQIKTFVCKVDEPCCVADQQDSPSRGRSSESAHRESVPAHVRQRSRVEPVLTGQLVEVRA